MQHAGLISASDLMAARAVQAKSQGSLDRILVSEGLLDAETMITALSRYHGLPRVDLLTRPPSEDVADLIPLRTCLNHSVIPWRMEGHTLTIAASRVEDFTRAISLLQDVPERVDLVFAPASDIQSALARIHRAPLTRAASCRVPEEESCRDWGRTGTRRLALVLAGLLALLLITALFPRHVFGILTLWAAFTLIVAAGLRIASYVAHVSSPPAAPPPVINTSEVPLPKVSVLVRLFKEKEIASHLVTRLSRLTYPKSLLDVVLVLEENDETTHETIRQSTLPPWMRVIAVPEGSPKTKPRAMNYALDFCDGDIIGIWDAEDEPDPDQISIVADRFRSAPRDLVCLQGALDYYNSRQNWLARCFTIEYAAWFRLMLPGMSRLGLAIPLGGTTLFFRRDVLEELGGWDAHNVTEDADLGFRLARHGYRTEVIPTMTGEEANCRLWRWVRQRSRWLKGYMVTYLVHMRRPLKLYRQLGARKFWGFQAHFVTALSQFVLAPFLWSFWLVLLGLPHPLDPFVTRDALLAFGILFLGIEVISILVNATAVSAPRHRHLLAWVPTMHFYYPLGAIAAYKALYELIFKPFYWDKTQHGHFLSSKRPLVPASDKSPGFTSQNPA
ncbi:MAG: glycosyl transferase [Rhodobacterales bacterium]|nr:MAG: glycosyl transferase [Rhodobacterales bacterium]